MTLEHRFASVLERVAAAAERSGREASDVTVVAVSKTFPADVLMAAIEVGAVDLGENRAQELKQKQAVVSGARWHFVGHLQTNKVRHVVGVALVHSVDRFGLGEAIARRASAMDIVQDVLIEVNVSGEASKHGVAPERMPALAERLLDLDGLRIAGLMAMPPFPNDPEESRPYFEQLVALRDELLDRAPEAGDLSMGMTRDFEIAVEEGATIVRVGEAIFGPRR
ncbi:MAG: YggS family pyridoxal phosphate-dependent enzyme [Actinomycetota bacterium]|nr:YggS family pyridoxal phosphate-dependent enzyme [Actinomycetota bacterium]